MKSWPWAFSRTFQNIRLFGSLSVFDNVRVACNLHRETGPLQSLIRMGAFKKDEAAVSKRVESLLDLFNLKRFRDAPAKSLPYGEQRRLEIVRCLATQPKLLLLDEPAAGMNPSEKVDLMRLIQRIQTEFNLSDPFGRAFDEGRDGCLPASRRPRLRSQNRGRKPRGNPTRSQSDRGLPRGRPRDQFSPPLTMAIFSRSMTSAFPYGAISALAAESASMWTRGTIVTLIGGNGAGKTTALPHDFGTAQIQERIDQLRGAIHYGDARAPNIVARGLCHVPEGRMIFSNLTVDENLSMGAFLRSDRGAIAKDREYVFGIFPRLKRARFKQTAGTLSGGEQQMLAIGSGPSWGTPSS